MPKLPSVTSSIPPDLRAYLERVREALRELDARTSSDTVTVSDLVSAGIAQYDTTRGLTAAPGVLGRYEAPPAPQQLEAEGALASVILTWRPPSYLGHAYTEVWAASELPGGGVPALGNAVLIGHTPGNVFSHTIGGGAARWYWVRFVNVAGAKGPFNSVAGTMGETGQDPEYLIDLLNGEITESELFQDLGERIDLIDADASVEGSVSARVQQEAEVRKSQTGALFAQYTVKIDLNGYVSGYGLASTLKNDTPESEFVVRADSFSIGTPGGTSPAPEVPFIVRTSPTTINGENVPVGVYVKDAFIQNGSISRAKIGNAAIDTAKIADAAITNAKIDSLSAGKINTGTLSADRIDAESITADKLKLGGSSFDDVAGALVIKSGGINTPQIASFATTKASRLVYSPGTPLEGNGSFKLVDNYVLVALPYPYTCDILWIASYSQGFYSGPKDWNVRLSRLQSGGALTSVFSRPLDMAVGMDLPTIQTMDQVTTTSVSNRLYYAYTEWMGEDSTVKLLGCHISLFIRYR